ncbi:MAG: PP2C family protein-serine/threonine phosphatase [bacterium]|nr:PP2C family protein-serine/threonine phosphatase [bacterium]
MDLLDRFDRYLELPRDQAYNHYLDERNLKIFKGILVGIIALQVILGIINIADNVTFNVSLILTIINIVILVATRIVYKNYFNVHNIRRYIFIFLIFQLFLSIAIQMTYPHDPDDDTSETKTKPKNELVKTDTLKSNDLNIKVGGNDQSTFFQYILIFGIVVLIFRFSRIEIIQLFAIGAGVPLLAMIVFNTEFSADNTVPNLTMGVIFFIIAFAAERKRRKNFVEQYDFHYKKNHESIRMKKELNYAREIQLSMLPENDATMGEIEISALSLPASEVGGDYFDYFKISENEIGFFICDVSGHGVASGLMLSGLRSCMHLILEDNSNPKIVLEKLNRMIRKTQSRKMFVTAVFAIIDTEKDKCTLFNAGHLPPYKISGESQEIFKIKKHGIALGAMNNVESSGANNEVFFDFKKGDKLILYTDGVNEAMDNNKAEYGLDSLELYLNGSSGKNAKELLQGIMDDIKKFTKNSLQRDDLTLLIIQRN